MKRRSFLGNAAKGVLLPYLLNGFSFKALAGLPHKLEQYLANDRVLVLIQLNGGNDGLNTVIPLDQYSAYVAARSNIAIPENKTLTLAGFNGTGLHPSLTAIQQLFNEGKSGIVQAVGYPNPNFSHFRATDIWMTASDSNKIVSTGWAGRYLDKLYPHFPADYPNASMPDPLAIQVGSVVSTTFQGAAFMMGLAISNPANFYNMLDDKPGIDASTRWGEQLAYIETMTVKTDQYAGVIKKAALRVTKQSDKYPAKKSVSRPA